MKQMGADNPCASVFYNDGVFQILERFDLAISSRRGARATRPALLMSYPTALATQPLM